MIPHSTIDLLGLEAIRYSSHVCWGSHFLDSPADGAPLPTNYLIGAGYAALPEPRHLKLTQNYAYFNVFFF